MTPSGRVGDREPRLGEDRPALCVECAAEYDREPGQHFGPAGVDVPIQDDLIELVLDAVDLGLAAAELFRLV